MSVRKFIGQDIPNLIALDQASHGKLGADREFFHRKFASGIAHILDSDRNCTAAGFVIIEATEAGEPLTDFPA